MVLVKKWGKECGKRNEGLVSGEKGLLDSEKFKSLVEFERMKTQNRETTLLLTKFQGSIH